jgi:hypothetical protein
VCFRDLRICPLSVFSTLSICLPRGFNHGVWDEPPEDGAETQVDHGAKNLVDSPPVKNLVDSPPVKDKGTATTGTQVLTVEFNLKLTTDSSANGAQFLINLLEAVQSSDPKAGILPVQSSSNSEKSDNGKCVILRSHADFPAEHSRVEAFVKQFIGDLCLTGGSLESPTSMRGKIRIQTRCKLSTLTKKKAVQVLNGENRLWLSRHTMSCGVRRQVGFFLNAITRGDLADLHQDRLRHLCDLPEFQIEVFTIYCDKAPVKVYRILSAKKNEESVCKALLKLHIEPLPSGMIFMPSEVWNDLQPTKRRDYLRLHAQFQEKHSGMLLRGIKNSEVRISSSDTSSHDDESVHQMVKYKKCADGTDFLFEHAEPCVSGLMELRSSKAREPEAKK